jgi:hypothetical protein
MVGQIASFFQGKPVTICAGQNPNVEVNSPEVSQNPKS